MHQVPGLLVYSGRVKILEEIEDQSSELGKLFRGSLDPFQLSCLRILISVIAKRPQLRRLTSLHELTTAPTWWCGLRPRGLRLK